MNAISIKNLYDVAKKSISKSDLEVSTKSNYLVELKKFIEYCDLNNITLYSPEVKNTYLNYLKENNHSYKTSLSVLNKFEYWADYRPLYIPKIPQRKPIYSSVFDETLALFEDYMIKGETNIKNIKHHVSVVGRILYEIDKSGIADLNQLNYSVIHRLFKNDESKFWFTVALRRFFKFCYSKGIINEDKTYILPQYYVKKPIPSVYSQSEIDTIINYVEKEVISLRDKLIFYMAYELALRTSDIQNIRIDNIDFERRQIEFDQYKTNERLKLGLSEHMIECISKYMEYERPVTDLPHLIIGNSYKRTFQQIGGSSINQLIKHIIVSSGVDIGKRRKGPHSLRATKATELMNMDIPLPVISSYLGHTSTESTKNYLKADIKHLRECSLDPIPVVSPSLCTLLGVTVNGI